MTALVIKTDSPVVAGPLQGQRIGRRSRMTATTLRSSMEYNERVMCVTITRDRAITTGRLTRTCP